MSPRPHHIAAQYLEVLFQRFECLRPTIKDTRLGYKVVSNLEHEPLIHLQLGKLEKRLSILEISNQRLKLLLDDHNQTNTDLHRGHAQTSSDLYIQQVATNKTLASLNKSKICVIFEKSYTFCCYLWLWWAVWSTIVTKLEIQLFNL